MYKIYWRDSRPINKSVYDISMRGSKAVELYNYRQPVIL